MPYSVCSFLVRTHHSERRRKKPIYCIDRLWRLDECQTVLSLLSRIRELGSSLIRKHINFIKPCNNFTRRLFLLRKFIKLSGKNRLKLTSPFCYRETVSWGGGEGYVVLGTHSSFVYLPYISLHVILVLRIWFYIKSIISFFLNSVFNCEEKLYIGHSWESKG